MQVKELTDGSVVNFKENVKTTIAKIQSDIFRKQEEKKNLIATYERMVKGIERDSEKDKLAMLEIYQRRKKHVVRAWENHDDDWRDRVDSIINDLDKLDYDLMDREMKGAKSYTQVIETIVLNELKNIYNDFEGIISSEDGLRQCEDWWNEFIGKFQDEVLEFAEGIKMEQGKGDGDKEVAEYDEMEDKYDGVDLSLFDNTNDDIKNITFPQIKEDVETRMKNADTDTRNKFQQEKIAFYKKVEEERNESNRKNVQNIIRFIEGERSFWEEKKVPSQHNSEED